jgi:hypothetical protein
LNEREIFEKKKEGRVKLENKAHKRKTSSNVNTRDIKEKRSSMKYEQKRHKIFVGKSPRMRELLQ